MVSEEFACGILHNFLTSDDESVKETIELAVVEGNNEIIDGLLRCLRDADIRSRMSGCSFLCALSKKSEQSANVAKQFLLHFLSNDIEWNVRFTAAEALQVLKLPRISYL